MTSQLPEDWGGSEGAPRPQISEENRQKRFERWVQVFILIIFCLFVVALKTIDYLLAADTTKDILTVTIPIFTFALGRAEPQ